MKSADEVPVLPGREPRMLRAASGALRSPRVCTYAVCTALALLVSWLLGKDMSWDTLDYHFYAGFSALHERFSLDYFPAGSQSYFNPYVYVPFFLLASSRLPALLDASILAVVQSGILWLTYEIALQLAPREDRRARITMTVCSLLLAFANPILLNQFGSSFADVITAELVLGGWLLLLLEVRTPRVEYVVLAALLLGAASALKLTNAVHAMSAGVVLLFVRASWSMKIRHLGLFGAALALSFVLICLPWSIRLEQHFGNPLFPVLNGIFRSPQFPTTRMLDYRFIPDSLAEALWRPFELMKSARMLDDERHAPDCRYAILLSASILVALRWAWRRRARARLAVAAVTVADHDQGRRLLGALGSAFLVDWALWLEISGNGRYFLPAACIAAVLAVAMIFRLCTSAGVRMCALAAVLGAQFVQLSWGTEYRSHIPWDGRPWFEVRLPAPLAQVPALYLSYGVQSNAFIVPFLPRGSGFVNIAGDYPLGPDGANGVRVQALIRRYSPHVRVVALDSRPQGAGLPVVSGVPVVADALRSLALRPVTKSCLTFVAPRYLVTCGVTSYPNAFAGLAADKRRAEAALDRLEDACPDLFQPARPPTQYFGTADHQEIWSRRYLNTNLTAWVTRGWVAYIDPLRGASAKYIAPVPEFADPHLRIECGRRNERYFVQVVGSTRQGTSK